MIHEYDDETPSVIDPKQSETDSIVDQERFIEEYRKAVLKAVHAKTGNGPRKDTA